MTDITKAAPPANMATRAAPINPVTGAEIEPATEQKASTVSVKTPDAAPAAPALPPSAPNKPPVAVGTQVAQPEPVASVAALPADDVDPEPAPKPEPVQGAQPGAGQADAPPAGATVVETPVIESIPVQTPVPANQGQAANAAPPVGVVKAPPAPEQNPNVASDAAALNDPTTADTKIPTTETPVAAVPGAPGDGTAATDATDPATGLDSSEGNASGDTTGSKPEENAGDSTGTEQEPAPVVVPDPPAPTTPAPVTPVDTPAPTPAVPSTDWAAALNAVEHVAKLFKALNDAATGIAQITSLDQALKAKQAELNAATTQHATVTAKVAVMNTDVKASRDFAVKLLTKASSDAHDATQAAAKNAAQLTAAATEKHATAMKQAAQIVEQGQQKAEQHFRNATAEANATNAGLEKLRATLEWTKGEVAAEQMKLEALQAQTGTPPSPAPADPVAPGEPTT